MSDTNNNRLRSSNNSNNNIDNNEDNNDSSTTTTTTVNSNRFSNNLQQQSIQQRPTSRSPNRLLSLQQMDSGHPNRYQIQHLSEDQDDEDDFLNEDYDGGGGGHNRQSVLTDDLDVRGIVDYFDESELQPTTANMILEFDPHRVLEIPEKRSILKSDNQKDESSDENKELLNEQSKLKRLSAMSSVSGSFQQLKSNMKKPSLKQPSLNLPVSLNRNGSLIKRTIGMPASRSNSKSNLITTGSISELKRLQKLGSTPKSQAFAVQRSDEDFSPQDEEDFEFYQKNKSELVVDERKQPPVSADMLANKRMLKQKQHELELQHQKQIKNLSKQQIQERQHLHQYPHPTQQQRLQQQQQMKLMYSSNAENSNNRANGNQMKTSTSAANLQTGSGYILDPNDKVDLWGRILIGISYIFLIFSFPFSLCTCVKVAQEYERAVIFRLGRILTTGEKGPGIFFVLPCIDTYTKVDLRTVTFDVPPQEILTRDSVTVSVDAVVYFRIFNAVISVINIEDAAKSTKLLAASTLRNILGTKSLHEILSDRESVAILIQFRRSYGTLGVKVERVEVKDVRLPVQLQRAMATEAEAAREARAKVIAAEGEQKASKSLKEAADVISESPIAIQLRYLQTLTQIASEKNSTIVFPIPLEMLSSIANKSLAFLRSSSAGNKSRFIRLENSLIQNKMINYKQVNFNDIPNSDAKYSAEEGFGFCGHVLIALSYFMLFIGLPFTLCCCMKVVQEYQRAVIFRLGRILTGGAKGPGLFFILPCIDNLVTVDLRTITFDVPPQEILTKDSVTVTVDAVVYFRIFDPVASVINVENAQYSTRLLAATTLRNILGTKTLQEVLQDRESLAHHMQDVRLPVQLQRAMATEAEATREARAKVVAAQGEQNASVALKEAADTINKSPIALQLRYLQTLTHIAGEKNSTIVFPIPIEFLKLIGQEGSSSNA